jgi:hypothetical protein
VRTTYAQLVRSLQALDLEVAPAVAAQVAQLGLAAPDGVLHEPS